MRPRRGLVLAGGGAKGAYAYGCLTAFRECGVEFQGVAGTSVGALNAAIWSRQAFALGDVLWSGISFATMMPARHRRWFRPFYYLEGFFRVALQLQLATWAGVPVPGRRLWAAVSGALAAAPILLVVLLVPHPTHFPAFTSSLQWLLAGAMAAAFAGWLLYQAQVDAGLQLLGVGRVIAITLASLLVLSPPVIERAVMLIWGSFDRVPRVGGVIVLAVGVVVGAIAWLYLRVIRAVTRTAERLTRRSFFVNHLLRQQVARVLEVPPLPIPVYVCAAARQELFTGWVDLNQIPRVHRTPLRDTLARETAWAWVPRYVEIRELPPERAADLLLASAALPFGLLPPIEVEREVLVDGGIIDNVPAFPLVQAGFDELFIIVLDHIAPTDPEHWRALLARQWVELELKLRSAATALPPDSVHRSQGHRWPVPEPRTPPPMPRVVVIRPSAPIGRFLSGTLNFKGAYAQRLMALGRRDALVALDQAAAVVGT